MMQAEHILFLITLILYFAVMVLYFLYVAIKKPLLSKLAIRAHAGVLLLHTAAILLRGVLMGRLPMSNQYEFATAFAWALALVGLVFILKFRFPVLGAFALPVTLLLALYAGLMKLNELRTIAAYEALGVNGVDRIRNLMPALRSSWLGIHVSTVILAYGAFGVSFVLSIIFLLRGRMKENGFWDTHIPKKEKLDLISYRCVSLGMMFLTATILIGGIWAENAWGSYWSWDPKETWALVTWLIYLVYLHLRIRRGWNGKAAAIFCVVGFICVLFTYIGVNTLLTGLHSYK
ncbi:MAG: c-type cytochrome biogenesis protein CcsB [Clostridia bacterium]|nr:c-type cytochrome biogenesis protein CcsB [Clostridia bacterium]